MDWTTCGYVSRRFLNYVEVSPKGKIRSRTGEDFKRYLDIGGYPCIYLKRSHGAIAIHRIILETYKPKPHPAVECDHRDGDTGNFALENLRWVTHQGGFLILISPDCLNISFQNHTGYTVRYNKRKPTVYRVRFRNTCYGNYKTPQQAREQYLWIKSCWQREERERITKLVMTYHFCSRTEAIDMLNWDKRDDVDFLIDF